MRKISNWINIFLNNLEYFSFLAILSIAMVLFFIRPKFSYILILTILLIFSVFAIFLLYKILKID